MGVSTLNKRLFPWDSSGSAGKTGKTTASLHIRNYGSGLKSAATFTGAITGSLFNTAGYSLFGNKGMKMNYAATSTKAKLDSDTKIGYLSMTYLKETWGGSCCKAGHDGCVKAGKIAADGKENTDTARYPCDAETGNILPFAVANGGSIAQSYYTDEKDKENVNTLMSLTFNGAMDLSSTTLTAVRGKGGFGSTQTLVDVFFQMMVGTSGNAIQTLMHFYVEPKTATKEADMNVIYGYPSNVYTDTYGSNLLSANTGEFALSTGLKLYFTKATKPVADYYGFYVPRMIPFYTSNGGNEIETRCNSATRKVQCWNWGSYNGAGFADTKTKVDASWGLYFATNHATYKPTRQFAGINMVICKVNKATAASSIAGYTGDVVVIPATQTASDNTKTDSLIKYKSHDPVPGVASKSPLPSDLKGLTAVANTAETKMTILGGADQYLGALSHIATTLTTEFAKAAQKDTIEGEAAKLPFPLGFAKAQRNDNTDGDFDILNAEGTTSDVWLIGAKKMGALLKVTMGTKADWATIRSQMIICAPRAGILTSTLEMRGGAKDGEMCTAAFDYDVGQQDINVNTDYQSRKQRFCRWCPSTRVSTHAVVFIKDFVPPTTSTRLLKGISVWGADTAGKQYITIDTYSTKTTQGATKVKTGDCGKDSQTLKRGTAGQVAEFSIKNSIALAAAQMVVWESTNTKVFILDATKTTTNSVRCTCTGASGSYTWNTILTKARSNLRMVLKLPTTGEAKLTNTEVVCAAGTVSCVARDWVA
jgi:hypothetical protein